MVSPDNGEQVNIEPMATPPATKTRRGWVMGAAILGVVAIVGVAAGYVVSQFGAGGDSSLRAIPEDADVVFRVDFTEYGDKVESLIHAFTEPLAEAGHIDDADLDLLALLDEELGADAGITISDDISPWIGTDVSAALFLSSDFSRDPDFIIAAAVKDEAMAAEFVEKAISQTGTSVETVERDGGTMYYNDSSGPDEGYVWLGDQVLVAANSEAGIDRSIEALASQSIQVNTEFEAIDAALPDTPILEMFISSVVFEEMAAQSATFGVTPSQLATFDGIGSTGVAISVVESGLVFDSVQTVTGEDSPLAAYIGGENDLVTALPATTYGYIAYTLPTDFYDSFISQMSGADLEGVEEEFRQMFGVDLFDELLPSLGPDSLLAVMESDTGFLADELGVPIGAMIALELSDPVPMTQFMAGLEQLASFEGIEISGETTKTVVVDGSPVAAYTIAETSFSLATSGDLLDGFLTGTGGLTDSAIYQELDDVLIGEGMTTFFDLEAIFDELPIPADERAVLAPLRGFGASATASEGLLQGQALVLIDY